MKTIKTYAMMLAAAFCAFALFSCEKDDDSSSIPAEPIFGTYTWTWSDLYVNGVKFFGYNPADEDESWILVFNEDFTFEEDSANGHGTGTFSWDSENAVILFKYKTGCGLFPGNRLEVKSWTSKKQVITYNHGESDTGEEGVEVATLTK